MPSRIRLARQNGSLRAVIVLTGAMIATLLMRTAVARGDSPREGREQPRELIAANGLLNRGMHELAAAEYRKLLDRKAAGEYAATARYGLGVCLAKLGQQEAAAEELRKCADATGFEFAADARLLLARCEFARGRFAEAAGPLQRLLSDAPTHALAADAGALLVECYARQGKHELVTQSAAEFSQRFGSSPLRERVLLLDGLSRAARSDWEGSATSLRRWLADFPTGAAREQANFVLAQACERLKRQDEAAEAYRAAAESEAGRFAADAWLGLARVEQARGRWNEALSAARRLRERFPQSPAASDAALIAGDALARQGKFDEAAGEVRGTSATVGEPVMRAAYWRAKAALKRGESADAVRALTPALADATAVEKCDATLLRAMRYDLAFAQAQAGDDAAALRAADSCLSAGGDAASTADLLVLKATCEHRLKRFDECRATVQRFARECANSESAAAVEFLGAENELAAGRYEAAAAAYREFVARRKSDAREARATLRLGLVLQRLGKADEARSVLSPLAPLATADASLRGALLALGEIAFERQEWQDAERWFAEYAAGDAAGRDADLAMLKRGIALEQLGKHADAVSLLTQMIQAHASSPLLRQARFERGQALLAQERTAEAASDFEQVIGEPGDAAVTAAALNHLAALELRAKRFERAIELATRGLELAGAPASQPNAEPRADAAISAELARTRGQARLASGDAALAEADLATWGRAAGGDAVRDAATDVINALVRREQWAEALVRIERLEQSGMLAAMKPNDRGRVLYQRATCLKKTNQAESAAAVLGQLVALDGAGVERGYARVELAEREAAAGRCAEAVRLLGPLMGQAASQQASAASGDADVPDELRLHAIYRYAACQFELGQYQTAHAALTGTLERFAGHKLERGARYIDGEALLKLDKPAAALEQFTRVLAVKGDAGDEMSVASQLRLGEANTALGNWAAAEEAFERFAREHPTHASIAAARFGVGWARENLARHDEAIAAYRQVVDAANGAAIAARAQFQIGECLFARKQLEAAAAELLKVDILYAHAEWSAAALYEAGRCFEQLGKPVEAREQFKAVRARFGDSRWAALADERLKNVDDGGLPGRGERRTTDGAGGATKGRQP